MERISETGWVPKDEKENFTLEMGGITKNIIKDQLKGCVYKTKKEAMECEDTKEFKRVRVIVTVDVERL